MIDPIFGRKWGVIGMVYMTRYLKFFSKAWIIEKSGWGGGE